MNEQLGEYYEQHGKTVNRFLFRLCGNAELARELTQETFYRAMRTIDGYRGDCKPSVWLCQIAKNVWYRYLQKEKKHCTQELNEQLEDASKPIIEHVTEHDSAMLLYLRLHELSGDTRELMYLRILGELSFADIGLILGRSENWARVTYYRTKEKLAKGAAE